jgi:hypothetical protein
VVTLCVGYIGSAQFSHDNTPHNISDLNPSVAASAARTPADQRKLSGRKPPSNKQIWQVCGHLRLESEFYFFVNWILFFLDVDVKRKDGTVAFSQRLPHGSFIIGGEMQKNFKHEVPKERGITQPCINLTFRRIEHN